MACGEALVPIYALFATSPIVDVHGDVCPSVWALGRFSSPISCVSSLPHPLLTRDVSVAFQSSLEGGAAKHLSVAIATHLAAVNRRPGSSWGGGKRNKRDEGMFRKDLDSIS